MNPQVVVPEMDVLPLPAAASLLHVLLLTTFMAHLLAMNVMFGWVMLGVWSRWRSRAGDDHHAWIAQRIGKVTPNLVAATVSLGVAPLLFLQVLFGRFFFTSSILMGWAWFSVVIAVIIAYYASYGLAFGPRDATRRRILLPVIAAVLFTWVAFVYVNNTTLMLVPDQWARMYFASAAGLHLNVADPQVMPRFLHVVLGGLAVGGLALAWWGWAEERRNKTLGEAVRRHGLAVFMWMSMANVLVGLWFFMAVKPHVRRLLMGESLLGTGLLGLGLLLGVVVIVMAARARRAVDGRGLHALTVTTLVTIAAMIGLRDVVREGYLLGLHHPGGIAVQPQVFNIVLFALLLVAGIATVAWMLRKLFLGWGR